jgi:hypothetical protein
MSENAVCIVFPRWVVYASLALFSSRLVPALALEEVIKM